MRYDKRWKNDAKWSSPACSESWFSVARRAHKEPPKTVYSDIIKGFEWNMIFILNQTAPSLFLLTSNRLLSLWAWTEPGMKSPLSPTNPARWVYVHRRPNKKTAVTGPVCGESLMKPNEIGLSKSATAFLSDHGSSGCASPPHRSLTRNATYPRRWERREMAEKSFCTPFFPLKRAFNLCNMSGRRWRLNLWLCEEEGK